jgi:DNA-binding transcriptional LysR family regulator
LPEVISRSRAAHPYLNIEADEVDAEEAREAIRAGRAELSVGYDFAYGEGIKREVIATTPAPSVPKCPLSSRPRATR